MDPAVFEEWMMTGLVSILIIFMGFIVWDLAKKSKAGRFGSFILFFVLGLGVAAFMQAARVIVDVFREQARSYRGRPCRCVESFHPSHRITSA